MSDRGLVDLGSKIAGVLDAHDPEATAAKVRELTHARDEAAREVLAPADAWARVELPAWVRERWPGIDLTEPSTLPEPDRCADGRPWGADAYGSVWGSVDDRWRAYTEHRGRPCRNRWRDRTTLLCGTHLNAWQSTRLDAERRVRRANAHAEATELARELCRLGVLAEAGAAGVVLRPDDARALIELLGRTTPTPTDTTGA